MICRPVATANRLVQLLLHGHNQTNTTKCGHMLVLLAAPWLLLYSVE
jgi:hypothetical protein